MGAVAQYAREHDEHDGAVPIADEREQRSPILRGFREETCKQTAEGSGSLVLIRIGR